MEYAHLSDFDLLHNAHQEIWHRPWATLAGHLVMDTHFKILRAHEEIDQLNVEICHIATYLQDEDYHLRNCKKTVQLTDPALAHQIGVHHMLQGRFHAHHEHCLASIAKMDGFTGTIAPGKSLDMGEGACVFPATSISPSGVIQPPPLHSDLPPPAAMEEERLELKVELEGEEEDEAVSRDILDVLGVSLDCVELQDDLLAHEQFDFITFYYSVARIICKALIYCSTRHTPYVNACINEYCKETRLKFKEMEEHMSLS